MMRWIAVGVAWVLVLVILAGLVWMIGRSVRRTVDPALLLFRWVLTVVMVGGAAFYVFVVVGHNHAGAFVGPIVSLALGVVLSIIWTPSIATWLIRPVTSAFDGGNDDWDPGPLYSIAIARRKRGQFQEAIDAVHKQLAKYPQDFSGQLLLAEIYADNLRDLPQSTSTVEALCAQPGHSPKNLAYALNELADWQMQLGADPEAARATLQRIVDEFSGTDLALVAAQRLAHVAGGATLAKLKDRTPRVVRPGVQNVGLMKQGPVIGPEEETVEQRVQGYVDRLEAHPLDQEAREKLASLYAEHYHRLDLAVDQLEQLIALPHQTPRTVARYLEEMADWQVRFGEDGERARLALQRIVDLYPGSAMAERAVQRISRLGLEVKGRRAGAQPVKMGVYEQNLGLKKKE